MPRIASALHRPEFLELVAAQDGVLSRAAATELGIGSKLIARRAAAGQWQTVGSHVVVTHAGPLSTRQRYWVAVTHAGQAAALFGLTALEAAGLRGLESPVVHAVVSHGRGRRDLVTDQVHVKVHESLHVGPEDVHPVLAPRRQRSARAAVDAASCASSEGRCRAIVAAVVQQRLTTAEQLRAYAERFPTLPRRALILETIDDVQGGAHSLPELEWSKGLRRTGLPTPTRQQIVRNPRGHYYLDADFGPWQVSVEINGAQHLDLLAREADDERRFLLSVGGRLVVDLASFVVRHDIGRAMLRTARALHSRGWRPQRSVLRRLQRLADERGEQLWLPPLVVPESRPA